MITQNQFSIEINEAPATSDTVIQNAPFVQQTMPLSMQLPDNSWWQLPFEPTITLNATNKIIKRYVAKSKGRGSIKERWTEDDITIKIDGRFINTTDKGAYPEEDVQKLRRIVTQRRAIGVRNDLLQQFNINFLVVETYSIPYTVGQNVQSYTLNCLSDDTYNLFIELK